MTMSKCHYFSSFLNLCNNNYLIILYFISVGKKWDYIIIFLLVSYIIYCMNSENM